MAKVVKVDDDGNQTVLWEGVGDVLLSDHLSQTSRALRRNLLISCSLGVIASTTGIIPKTILGVDLSGSNQSTLIWLLILSILYTGLSYLVHTWPERMKVAASLEKLDYKPKGIGDLPIAAIPSGLRNFLDYRFPAIYAFISISLLLWVLLPNAGDPADNETLGIVARSSITFLCLLVCWLIGFKGSDRIIDLTTGGYSKKNPDEKVNK